MEQLIQVILAAFGIYRISSLISREEGPYLFWPKSEQQIGIFKAIRIKAGSYNYGPDGEPETSLARGISCSLCVGLYISLPMLFLVFFPTSLGNIFLVWFGLAGIQAFLTNQDR